MNDAKQRRNGLIEVLRFLFSIMVVFYHGKYLGDGKGALFPSLGFIAVEFFFIVSGYLMAQTAAKKQDLPFDHPGVETLLFLWNKWKRFLPYYCIAAGGCIAFMITHKNIHAQMFLTGLWDFLFLGSTGAKGLLVVSAAWYLSAMLLAMLILYPLLRKYRETFTHIIAPLIAFLLFGYLSAKYGRINQYGGDITVIGGQVVRAIAGLSLGIVCHTTVSLLDKIKVTTLTQVLIGITVFVGFLVVFYLCHYGNAEGIDVTLCLMVAILVTLTFWQCNWPALSGKFFSYLGEYSLVVYLNHRWIQFFLRSHLPKSLGYRKLMLLFLLASLIISLLIMLLWRWLRFFFYRYGNKIKALFIISN